MRLNVAIPEAHVSAPVLDAALEATTRLNEALLKSGDVPTFDSAVKQVRWQPEPPGEEHFDHAGIVMKRGHGDCDDLAPWHAASLRHTGEDPGATAIVTKSGPKRWHAIVQRSDGHIEDPSKAAGMGSGVHGDDVIVGVLGAAVPLMYPPSSVVGGSYIVRPAIAMRPVRGDWQARADLPWNWREHLLDKPRPTDYAMVSLHQDPVASTALTGAIDGVLQVGEICGIADPEHVDRLCAIADCINGASYDELAHIYGEEHALAATHVVGSFFKKLGKGLKGVVHAATAPARAALHVAAKAVAHIPGIGKVTHDLLKMAEKAASGDPKALIEIAKSPIGKQLINFIPGVGPVASMALQEGLKAMGSVNIPGFDLSAAAKLFDMQPHEMQSLLNVATQFPSVPG